MALTVGWLLSQIDLRLTLAAGGAGVDKEISWAHAIELEDPTPWLGGGELVLTTGMRLPRAAARRREYVTRLDEAGAAALGFGLGLSHDRIPDDLLAAAGERGFPVLAVPLPVPFVAITRAVADRLAEDRMLEIRRTVDHQDRMARAAIEGGVAGVIRRLARAVAGHALVTDANHVVLAAEPGDSPDLVDRLRAELVRRRRPGLRFAVASSDGRDHLTIQSLAATSVVRGYLAVATPSGPSEMVRLLISHAATLVALELERPRDVRAIDRRVRAIVLQLAVEGALDEEVLARHTQLFGFSIGEPVAVFVVHSSAPRLQLENVLETVLAERATPYLCTEVEDGMALLLPASAAAGSARDLTAAVGSSPRHEVRAGVGGSTSLSDIATSLRQATYALRTARAEQRRIVLFEDLGAYSLLFAGQPRELIEAVAAAVLAPLDEHDAANRGDLVRSVASFLRHNGHWESAAAMLGVHRHTLRYRIRKVEQLTGRRLNSALDRAEFLVALAAREISDPSALQS
jgi:PucR family transcriptional regulator, purine catabolism regulatory protein